MALTRNSVEELIDLVEIKLSCMEVFDTNDKRTFNRLEQCCRELYELSGKVPGGVTESLHDSAAA